MIPPPTAADLEMNAAQEYADCERYIIRPQLGWIRRAVHAEAALTAAKVERERAMASVDGEDLTDIDQRDNADPDQLRHKLLGAGLQLAAAQKFKAFVHAYLTQHGVPEGDPENQHQKEGCRIGARLDLLFAERDAAKFEAEKLRNVLVAANKTAERRGDALAAANAEVKRLTLACQRTENDVQQILGKALGVCVGDHTAASLASEAAQALAGAEQWAEAAEQREAGLILRIVRWLQDRAAEYEKMPQSVKTRSEQGWPETLLHNVANEIGMTFRTAALAATPAPPESAKQIATAEESARYQRRMADQWEQIARERGEQIAELREALERACWGLENAVKENPARGYYASKADEARAALAAREPPRPNLNKAFAELREAAGPDSFADAEPSQATPEPVSWEVELSGLVESWREGAASARQTTPGLPNDIAATYDKCADALEAMLSRRVGETKGS